MTWLAALVLGVVQGLTEFLPISSTAHVALAARILGLPDHGMAAYTAVIQLGTLGAVLVYFARDLWQIAAATLGALLRPRALGAVFSPAADEDPAAAERNLRARLGFFIVLGTVPIGLCGVAFKHLIEHQLRSPLVMAGGLIVLAIALYLAERMAQHRRTIASLGLRDALIVGGAQALALIPGASRSGVTLTAGLFCGLRRDDAARYSFLLSVPAVLAAAVFEMKDAVRSPALGANGLGMVLLGTAASFVVGYATIAWLLRFLRTRTTLPFVAYRLLVGSILFGLVVAGVMK
jgi:undecaprenyl-diphosphatase